MTIERVHHKRILICGGRKFANLNDYHYSLGAQKLAERQYNFVHEQLDYYAAKFSGYYNPTTSWLPMDLLIIHGAAKGVDDAASHWANINHANQMPFPIKQWMWDRYKKAAGPIRNSKMLKEGKPDICITFPGGRGTENMIAQAEKAKIEVIKISYV